MAAQLTGRYGSGSGAKERVEHLPLVVHLQEDGIITVEARTGRRIGPAFPTALLHALGRRDEAGVEAQAVAATMPLPSSTASSVAGSITVQPTASA